MRIVELNTKRGYCSVTTLALAFHTSFNDAYAIMKSVKPALSSGVTTREMQRGIDYACALYNRKAYKRNWKGDVYDFIHEHPSGLFIVNCTDHITLVWNGVMFDNYGKNYEVYNVWQIENVKHEIVEQYRRQVLFVQSARQGSTARSILHERLTTERSGMPRLKELLSPSVEKPSLLFGNPGRTWTELMALRDTMKETLEQPLR